MKRIKREDEEGAMGVGTLIVFIAMVLVAAVAASVLIDTANKLQQQAQKTGDQAIREVSTSFVVKDVYGTGGDTDNNGVSGNELDEIKLKVGLAAGAPAQELNQTVIQIGNGSAENDLEANPDWSDGVAEAEEGTYYGIEPLMEQDGGEYGVIEQGDTVLITIKLDEDDTNIDGDAIGNVEAQTEVQIRILPKHGTPTYESFDMPPVLMDNIVHLA
ncbi:MAG: archaellin/type IV pilin N-terminal domain-containing protein [Thermoplasmatota archaeon]